MLVIQGASVWGNFTYYNGEHVPEEIQQLNLDVDLGHLTKCAIC